MLALLAAMALAYDDPNREVTVHAQVVYAFGQNQPWGGRIGADGQFAMGDHCTYPGWEEGDCSSATVWPLAGIGGSVTWRGGDRFSLEVDGEVGVSGLEMAHFGFVPFWQVFGRVGFRFDVDDLAPGLVLGGFASKSFGLNIHDSPNSYHTVGTHGFGLRVDLDTAWMGGPSFEPPTLGVGLYSPVSGARYLD